MHGLIAAATWSRVVSPEKYSVMVLLVKLEVLGQLGLVLGARARRRVPLRLALGRTCAEVDAHALARPVQRLRERLVVLPQDGLEALEEVGFESAAQLLGPASLEPIRCAWQVWRAP